MVVNEQPKRTKILERLASFVDNKEKSVKSVESDVETKNFIVTLQMLLDSHSIKY